MREKLGNSQYDKPCSHPTYHSSCDEAKNDNPIRCWRNKDFFYRFLEFCHIKWWDYMGKWVHDEWHHDESRDDKLHIIQSSYLAHTWADKLTKNHIIKSRRDDWWNDGLFPYSQKSSDFLADNSHVGDEKSRWIHRNKKIIFWYFWEKTLRAFHFSVWYSWFCILLFGVSRAHHREYVLRRQWYQESYHG